MTFGANSELVDEVVDFARHGNYLVGAYRGDRSVVHIETDFPTAMELARSQEPEGDYLIWSDLVESEMAELQGEHIEHFGSSTEPEPLARVCDELVSIVRKRLARTAFAEVLDEVASDFYCLAFKRAVRGKGPHFFETVYQAYLDGGWPCGWKGNYPAGKLVVYSSKC